MRKNKKMKLWKKILLSITSFIVILLLFAGGVLLLGEVYHKNYKYDVPSKIEVGSNEIKTITSKGKALYDEEGNIFNIKGVNFGNLLISEGWMTVNSLGAKYNEDGSYVKINEDGIVEEYEEVYQEDVDRILNERFTETQIKELNDAYFYSYCTEQDFINIKSLGLNTIRLPMYYRNFMEGEDEALVMKSDAFEKVDYFLELAKKHDLRVILDMHGVVGGQSGFEHSGTRDIDFWDNEIYQQEMCTLWKNIALHYVTTPAEGGRSDLASTILAFDLVNEPVSRHKLATGKKEWKVMDKMYEAIRSVDPYHVISIEGMWYFNSLPNPKKYGWENVLYQYHFYNWNSPKIPNWAFYNLQFSLLSISDYDVPKFVGEFNFFNETDEWHKYLNIYDQMGIGWTIWSYKIISVGWWDSSWGMAVYKMNLQNEQLKLDLRTASFEEIYSEWSTQYTDDGTNNGKYKFEGQLVDIVREYFNQK